MIDFGDGFFDVIFDSDDVFSLEIIFEQRKISVAFAFAKRKNNAVLVDESLDELSQIVAEQANFFKAADATFSGEKSK